MSNSKYLELEYCLNDSQVLEGGSGFLSMFGVGEGTGVSASSGVPAPGSAVVSLAPTPRAPAGSARPAPERPSGPLPAASAIRRVTPGSAEDIPENDVNGIPARWLVAPAHGSTPVAPAHGSTPVSPAYGSTPVAPNLPPATSFITKKPASAPVKNEGMGPVKDIPKSINHEERIEQLQKKVDELEKKVDELEKKLELLNL